jgi:hypothetical protein
VEQDTTPFFGFGGNYQEHPIELPQLRHRIIVTYEAEAEEIVPEDMIQQVFDHIEVP